MFKSGYVVFILFYTAVSVLAKIDISLNGTVNDEKGTAIIGAVVTLASDSLLKDTTDASGNFIISNETSVIRATKARALMQNISIKNSQLRIYLSSPASYGTISVFSANGTKCAVIALENMEQGLHTYMLPELTSGFYVMNVRIDQSNTTCRLIHTGSEIFMSEGSDEVSRDTRIFRNAAVENIDTLIVKKGGYKTVKQAVASYKQTAITIVMAKEESGPVYSYGAIVENTCSDCVVPELPDASKLTVKNSKLPDPFKKIDGTRITKKSEWRCRRQEILKQAMKYIYGDKPAPPQVVSGTVTNTKISVHVEDNGKTIDFSATVKLPTTGQAPYPAIINMGTYGIEVTNKASSQGVAVIYYDYSKIAGAYGDASAGIRDKPPQGLFFDMYGTSHSARQLMAWAWGASRLIDVLQKSGGEIIDYKRLAVTGCSRDAKGAFAIGLFDERVSLTLPEETSLGGLVAYRIADAKCAENTDNNYNGQTWLSNNFKPFVKNTSLLPIDAHELVAAFAPRGLYSMENSASAAAQMCAPGGNMAIQGGMDVYKALGAEKNLTYNSNTPSSSTHCRYTDNFTDPLIKNITKFLKHQTAETGGIVAGTGTLKKTDWIDWTVPTLEDDTKIYSTNQ